MALNVDLDMRVEPIAEVDMKVEDRDTLSFGVDEVIVDKNHATLDNRDLPDQHPISAITGLQEALDNCGAIDTIKVNGTALPIVNKAVDVPVPVDADLVHKAGEETITGKKTFTSSAEISRSDSGAILKLSSSAADTNFILERIGGSQCVLESGTALGLFGTKTNHPLQIRTNYTNRMTIGTDGSIKVATAPAANSDDNQVATTKWVNDKGYAQASAIPTKTSDLNNDSGFITSSDVPVASVNGKTGAVVLDASDVNALPNNTSIPTKTSDLTNDSGFVTHDNETEQAYISNPSSYTYWRGLAIGASAVSSESGALSTTTDKVYVADAIKVQPSTGTIKATTFKGDLTGTASGNLVASDLVAITTAEIDALFV